MTRLAAALWAVVALLAAAYVALVVEDRGAPLHVYGYIGAVVIDSLAFATVGALVAARQPRNPIGWIFLAIGALLTGASVAQLYAIHALLIAPGAWPGGLVAGWLGSWVWAPGVALVVIAVPLLFPNGHGPTQRWRWVEVVTWIFIPVASASMAIGALPSAPGATVDYTGQLTSRPSAFIVVPYASLSVFALVALAAMVQRARTSRGTEREQMKWFAYGGAFTVVGVVATSVANTVESAGPIYDAAGAYLVTSIAAIPLAAGIAILRYRLYDIDIVIRRTLVYGALAVLVTAVYVGVVVGIGALVGSRGGSNVLLSLLATALVAVAFQPARARLQHFANRLVFGRRATPYEVLADLSARLGGVYNADELLPRVAQLLTDATGSAAAAVWLRTGSALEPAAVWPAGESAAAVPVGDGRLPEFASWSAAVPVTHQGELLGALTLRRRATEPLSAAEAKLLSELAAQAGLVLRNASLTADLRARLAELRASRQRLVVAQDEARRRIERDLHDGAQQQLVALKLKLGLARSLNERAPAEAQPLLDGLLADADEALATLRELAHGIYPPLLAERGLADALAAQARRATVPVAIDADGVGRRSVELESAVYFCCLEALQNVQKYAGASRATIRLRVADGELRFEVADDGCGFDAASTPPGAGLSNMRDRLDALEGSLEIESRPGDGTVLRGRVRLAPSGGQPVRAEV